MRSPAAAALSALLLAGCMGATVSAELDAGGFAPVLFGAIEFFEVDLVETPELRLHADVYLPAEPLAPGTPTRFPAVLVLSPYWGNGTDGAPVGYRPYDYLVQELVRRGYAVVFGDLAGSGGSSGCWDFMGPVERRSSYAMVEAIAGQPWSDGKVGMMGISYDAMTQVMAASDRAPHLVTVVPVAPLTHAYGGILQNGVRYDGAWRTVVLRYEAESIKPMVDDGGRTVGWQQRLVDSPACIADNHAAELALDSYSAYFRARDYRPLGADVQASVFYMQGLRDASVKPDNFGAWFDAVPTLKKAWIGYWGHVYPDARLGGRDDVYATIHRWLDHTLKGVDNGIDAEPRFTIEDSRGRWRDVDEWPPREARPMALHLFPDGGLSFGVPADGTATVGGATALPGVLPGQPARGTNFTSVTFPDGLNVSGTPVLRLTLTSDRPVGQIVARIYENGWRMSQGALDLTLRDGLESPKPMVPGEPYEVSIPMYAVEHAVAPGASLLLEIATHDPTSWYEDDVVGATLTIATDGSSALILPVVDPPPPSV